MSPTHFLCHHVTTTSCKMADEPPPMDFEETPPPEDDIEQEKNENPFGDPSEVEEKETANEPPSKQEGIDSLIVQKWA